MTVLGEEAWKLGGSQVDEVSSWSHSSMVEVRASYVYRLSFRAVSTYEHLLISFDGALKTQGLSSIQYERVLQPPINNATASPSFSSLDCPRITPRAVPRNHLCLRQGTHSRGNHVQRDEDKYRPRTIENMDTRMYFANFVTTGRVLSQDRANRAGQRRGCVRAGRPKGRVCSGSRGSSVPTGHRRRVCPPCQLCPKTSSSSRVRVYCITHGNMQTRSCGALYEHTNGTVFKVTLQLTASDVHVVRLARHIVAMWAERWELYAKQEFVQVSRLVKPVKTEVAFTGPYAKRFRPSEPPSSITCPCGSGLRSRQHLILSCPRSLHALTWRSFPSPTPASSLLPRGLHASSTSFKNRAPAPDPNKALLRWIARRIPMCHLNPTR